MTDLDGALSGKPAGAGGLLKEAKDLLDRLKDKESREKAVDQGVVLLNGVSDFGCCVIGAEAILEKPLGKEAKKELAHVDMKAKLLEAGLKQFGKYPSLWPPTLAVRVECGRICCRPLVIVQVRELAGRVKALKKAGEDKPYVEVELKK